jgi:hypothetical protein
MLKGSGIIGRRLESVFQGKIARPEYSLNKANSGFCFLWRSAMKVTARIIEICAIIGACFFTSLHGQIRSDFVLVSDGEIPHVILDKEGRVHATWRGRGIHYGLFDSLGNPLQATKTISESGLTTFSRLAVSTDHIVVFWQSNIPGQVTRVAGLSFSPDSGNVIGTFGSTGNISAGSPDVIFLNDSTILAVWPGDGPLTPYPSTGIYGQVFTSALETKGNSQLISADVLEQSKHSYARVATNQDSDKVVVVWVAQVPNYGVNVFGRLLAKDGTPWDSTFIVGKDSHFINAWSSNVATGWDGNFVVVWSAENADKVWNIEMENLCRQLKESTKMMSQVLQKPRLQWMIIEILLWFGKDGKTLIIKLWRSAFYPMALF